MLSTLQHYLKARNNSPAPEKNGHWNFFGIIPRVRITKLKLHIWIQKKAASSVCRSYAIKTTPSNRRHEDVAPPVFRWSVFVRFALPQLPLPLKPTVRLSHDTIQCFLAHERARWSRQLWKRVKKSLKNKQGGYLIIDDTVIGKDDGSWKTEMTS